MVKLIVYFILSCTALNSWAQSSASLPRVPTSGGAGLQGSAGVGFTDFYILSPTADFKIERGTFIAASIERGFDFFNLYFTMTVSHMTAEGFANYDYTNLSSSTSYTVDDIAFKATMLDLGLGLKLKLIDDYWFRPYIEAGGLGGYDEVKYTSKLDQLETQGTDYKKKDVIMGSGFYGEAGIEVAFAERFGVKVAGRYSEYRTKELDTLDKRKLWFRAEVYYFSLLFGF